MTEQPRVSIVLPVYNEAENITPTLERLAAAVRTPCEILVVHDFDEDTTVPVVRAIQSRMPQVRLLRNDLGRGVLRAMRAGMADARAPYVVVSMADGSDDVAVIDAMVALADEGADVVAASRYMRGGHQIGGPILKGLLSRTAGLTLQWFGRVGTHDATNNFKLYSRRYLDQVTIESEGGFELALELTVKAALAGRMVREVPATWRDRTAGESRFRLRAWLPRYLHWYTALFAGRARMLTARHASQTPTGGPR
jgi:glycosyltransferase involved in cell wall biosynthesis